MWHRCRFALRLAGISGAIVAIAMVSGCAQIRKATYPQDFVYLSPDDVTTRMHQIAGHMAALDDLLGDLSISTAHERVAREMLDHLDGLQRLAGSLGEGAAGTNHLLLDAHLGDFVMALDTTRLTLSATPPRFYEVGRLVGSCNACHRFH